jgi:hypothetical protein
MEYISLSWFNIPGEPPYGVHIAQLIQ